MGGTIRISKMSLRRINLECCRDQATRLTVQVFGPGCHALGIGEEVRKSTGAPVRFMENEKEA